MPRDTALWGARVRELHSCLLEFTERSKGTPTLPVFLGNYSIKTLSWFPFDPQREPSFPLDLVYH